MKEIKFGNTESTPTSVQGKMERTPTNVKPGVYSQPTIKQEIQPKMVEITLMLDSKNKVYYHLKVNIY